MTEVDKELLKILTEPIPWGEDPQDGSWRTGWRGLLGWVHRGEKWWWWYSVRYPYPTRWVFDSGQHPELEVRGEALAKTLAEQVMRLEAATLLLEELRDDHEGSRET